jgi:hypothetical protein
MYSDLLPSFLRQNKNVELRKQWKNLLQIVDGPLDLNYIKLMSTFVDNFQTAISLDPQSLQKDIVEEVRQNAPLDFIAIYDAELLRI